MIEPMKKKDLPRSETFKYRGLSAQEKKRQTELRLKNLGCPARLVVNDDDGPKRRARKEAAYKEEVARRKKDAAEKVAALDADMTLGGLVFEKGKPVQVNYAKMSNNEASYYYQKLHSLCDQDVMELVEGK